MIKNVLAINESSTFKEAIKLLDENGNGFLPIVDNQNKLYGVLTDGDIRRAILNNKNTLHEIINKEPYFMFESNSKKNIIYKLKELHRKQMPIVDKNMNLIDIITLDDNEFNLKKNWVVIMAGGLGTRLGDLTKKTPKPMLKVANKPMIEHIIDMFISNGFTKFMLSVNYKAEVIKDYFDDGKKFGIQIKYLEEKQRLGTGGALSLIDIQLNEPFFVTNGDVISPLDYEELLKFHNTNNSIATMCIRKDSYQIPYGVIKIDSQNNIISMKEKPKEDFFINTGIYVLNPEVLKYIPNNKFFDLPSLFTLLKHEKKTIKSFETSDYWIDIGNISDYNTLNNKMNSIRNDR